MNAVPERAKWPYELAGSSAAVRECLARLEAAAADDRHVLLTAEAGLDAEAIARALVRSSARNGAPFVVQPCAGLSAADLERAVFGAATRPRGDLDVVGTASSLYKARSGVLFFAEADELPAPLQRRLARVLRDGEVRVVRRTLPLPLDVRVIAATRNPLEALVREDLLRRFPLVVEIPPLRQRREDVPVLAEAMLGARDPQRKFTPAALTVLSALPWRRNLSELSSLIEQLVAAGSATMIRQEDVLAEVQLDRPSRRATGNLRDARRQFEREFIAAVLRDHEWQMRDAARALGIERANLYRKARQLGIPLRREGTAERRVTG